jgi:putative zinc finger protein
MQTQDDLQRAVSEFLAEERRHLGSHPEPEELAAYQGGALLAEEEERIQQHLAACPDCTALLLDLKGLSDAAYGSTVSQTEVAAAWRVVRDRLRKETAATPGRIGMPGKAVNGGRWPLRSTSLAAVLLVTVGLLAFQVGRLQQVVGDLARPQLNAPVLDLRPSVRAEAGAAVPEVPSQARLFTLVINPIGSMNPGVYEAEIADAAGRRVWSGQGLEVNSFGSFSLALSRRTLRAGEYRLRLFSLAVGHRRLIGEYAFRIQAP